MSIITSLLATDKLKDSRAVINTNLANLNADKVETLANLGLTQTAVAYNGAVTNSPTAGEKAALVGGGAFGTPSAANKFVTETLFAVGAGNPVVVVFTANGTYTKPAGLKYVVIEAVGGGQGGVDTNSSGAGSGGSGGGGHYGRRLVAASALAATETVTIGQGGANNANGGNTSLGSLVVANGGGNASKGSGSTFSSFGGGASPGQNVANSLPAGSSYFGGGGGGVSGNSPGAAGRDYGGGGSGSSFSGSQSFRAGGIGAPGVVIVTEYF